MTSVSVNISGFKGQIPFTLNPDLVLFGGNVSGIAIVKIDLMSYIVKGLIFEASKESHAVLIYFFKGLYTPRSKGWNL